MPTPPPRTKSLFRHVKHVPLMMLLAAAVLFVVRDTRINSPGRKPLSAARDAGCADSGLVDDKGRAEESGTTNRDTLHPHPAAPGGIDKELEPFHGRGRDSAGTGNDSPPSGRQPGADLKAGNQSSGVDAEKDKKTVGNKQGARKTSAQPPARYLPSRIIVVARDRAIVPVGSLPVRRTRYAPAPVRAPFRSSPFHLIACMPGGVSPPVWRHTTRP